MKWMEKKFLNLQQSLFGQVWKLPHFWGTENMGSGIISCCVVAEHWLRCSRFESGYHGDEDPFDGPGGEEGELCNTVHKIFI